MYQLLSTLSRATALQDIYDAAITGLLSATEADRAAILMFDDDGVMRFKAWQGLSEPYRAAVTGHSPWSRGARDTRPRAIADAAADAGLAPFREVLEREGIRALAFIPLALDAGVFGKFMLYYAAPHHFRPEELEIAQAIATHIALAAQRKRSEIELRRATRQVENILASIRESFIALDRQWRFTFANDRVLDRAGLSREQLIGRNIWEVFPEARASFEEGYRRAMEGRVTVRFEALAELPPRAYEVHAYPTNEGLCAYILNITERKRTEESARQLAGIVEATSDFVAIARLDGGIVYLNQAGRAMIGIDGEAGAQHLSDADLYPPAVLEKKRSVWLPAALRDGSAGGEGALRARDGREIPASFVVVAHFGPAGEPDYVSTIARDIAERQQTENALRKVNAELEEFAYVASHDLQEPLRSVNIYSELLLRRFPQPDAQAEQYTHFIHEGVARMDTLLHDLLSYSRVIHGEAQRDERADLAVALDLALQTMKRRIEEDGVVVHSGPLPVVRGEAGHLAHVFENLLSNSIKYRRKGVAAEIRISAAQNGDEWIIAVKDNGIGFEQRYAERIFRLFQRLHRNNYEGTGLGLAICQRIIERYGGRIWAEGDPARGATFYFALPKAA